MTVEQAFFFILRAVIALAAAGFIMWFLDQLGWLP